METYKEVMKEVYEHLQYYYQMAMGGTIDVESELGQGSCFEVILDLKIAEDRTVALAAQEETDELGRGTDAGGGHYGS